MQEDREIFALKTPDLCFVHASYGFHPDVMPLCWMKAGAGMTLEVFFRFALIKLVKKLAKVMVFNLAASD
jgi:hypothetical protein